MIAYFRVHFDKSNRLARLPGRRMMSFDGVS
jgi:hypothetical protein